MKNKILILSLAAFLALAGIAQATHYVLGYSAVDEGEIRWGGSTTYSTQWNSAISTWNALNKINIAPDDIWTWEDLTISDVNDSAVGWVGLYTAHLGFGESDTIQFNRYYLDSDTSNERQNVTTHELGHALGLAHSFSGNVLYMYQTSQTSLGTQDVDDYRYLWGY